MWKVMEVHKTHGKLFDIGDIGLLGSTKVQSQLKSDPMLGKQMTYFPTCYFSCALSLAPTPLQLIFPRNLILHQAISSCSCTRHMLPMSMFLLQSHLNLWFIGCLIDSVPLFLTIGNNLFQHPLLSIGHMEVSSHPFTYWNK